MSSPSVSSCLKWFVFNAACISLFNRFQRVTAFWHHGGITEMFITLKHEARCADCGAPLPAGTRARWFRDGSVYGDACHRWRIELTARQAETLQRALQSLLTALRGREIPEGTRATLEGLKARFGQVVDRRNYSSLLAEIRALTSSLGKPGRKRKASASPGPLPCRAIGGCHPAGETGQTPPPAPGLKRFR